MSRCFPYPPRGYIPRSTVDGALIESIKLQREPKKSREEKHEKKAKKERKREKKAKKEKSKHHAAGISNGVLNDKKEQRGESSLVNLKGSNLQRVRKDEAEPLEKSDLTEEYGQPMNSQNSCHSSDSTENSRKRKRDTSLSGENSLSSSSSNHGNIIRLRLPLLKPKESEPSLTKSVSEQLTLPKNHGPEPSPGKGQSSSIRPSLLEHKEPEASVSKEQISSMRLPLKRKEPEASVSKEQSSSMQVPLLKRREPQASSSKEQSRSMRLPLLKQKGVRSEPEASINKEQSSSMRLPQLKGKEPEASFSKARASTMWVPPPKHKEHEASSNKERSCSISKHKESETALRKEQNHSVRSSLPKRSEAEASLREESCSTSGRVDIRAQNKCEIFGQSSDEAQQPCFSVRTDAVNQKLHPRPNQQLPSTTLEVPEFVVQKDGNMEKASTSNKSSRKQRAESRYKALVEDWISPQLQVEPTALDDEGWLFQKHEDRRESKLHQTVMYKLNHGSWPTAQYLPEADLHALPFAVPF